MKGTFFITPKYLKKLGPCADGYRDFKKHFPEGGEYQKVLDKCAELNKFGYASWLMDKIGPTEDVLKIESFDNPDKSLIFAGQIKIKEYAKAKYVMAGEGIKAGEGIEAGWGIKAGDGIEAGWGIKAGNGIEAGWGIKAGNGIEAGDDFCIFAGLRIKKTDWMIDAIVSARCKPVNLISGFWKEKENEAV